MAWNNNSGGPWGGGGGGNSGGPWGGGGGGNRGGGGGPFGSRRPPDMEDVIRKGQERLRNLIPGGFGSFKGVLLIALVAIVIWLLTGFFRVQPNQQSIQLVFGKPYGGPVDSGLHYNLPSPIGTEIEQDTKELMQKILDEYHSGVRIAQVQLQRADPPQDVLGAFRDVQAARADKERAINEANTYRNQVVPRAKGEAASIVQRAEA